jgi:hypothetical protein
VKHRQMTCNESLRDILKRLIDDVPIDEISEEINELSNNGNNDEDK